MSGKPTDPTTEAALRELDVAALNFAYQAINIASVRSQYVSGGRDSPRCGRWCPSAKPRGRRR